MVFAADVVCPLTIILVIGVVWFGAWLFFLKRQREKAEREAAPTTPPPEVDDPSVRERSPVSEPEARVP